MVVALHYMRTYDLNWLPEQFLCCNTECSNVLSDLPVTHLNSSSAAVLSDHERIRWIKADSNKRQDIVVAEFF